MAQKRRKVVTEDTGPRRVYTEVERIKGVDLIVKGWYPTDVARDLDVDIDTVWQWVEMARADGAPIPSNMDLRGIKSRKARLLNLIDDAIEFAAEELPKVQEMIRLARVTVETDLANNRTPVILSEQETTAITTTRGTLVDPRQSAAVYDTMLAKRADLLTEILDAADALGAMEEGLEAADTEDAPAATVEDGTVLSWEDRRKRLLNNRATEAG